MTNVIIMSKLVANSDVQLDKAVRTFVSKVGKESNMTIVDKEITYKNFLSNKMLIFFPLFAFRNQIKML
mgnify:CR=1 FL=1